MALAGFFFLHIALSLALRPHTQDPPSAYSRLEPKAPDADSIPGGLEPADLILFAAQIASGMVSLARDLIKYIHRPSQMVWV